ncbi:MAG: hypothetical protein BroJett040_12800 [Oligoflexia bacterium]|nr:MAG: hypothetical protein BroJett040_12800 [Oligoflexia bacterium]
MTQEFYSALNRFDWAQFLEQGAFLRLDGQHSLIWSGPFQISKELDYSIGYADFFAGSVQWTKAPRGPLRVSNADFIQGLRDFVKTQVQTLSKSDFLNPSRQDFETSFQVIQGKIQREEIEKAVPIVVSATEKRPAAADQANWMISLMDQPQALRVYGFWQDESGILGATPEILFEQKGGVVRTMALAGTRVVTQAETREESARALLSDRKELHEHQVVVQDIEKRLETIGWVRRSETRVLELPHLQHLLTELTAEGSQKTPAELIRLLHPTPALGVAPRAYGFQWMKDLSPQEGREKMGGPLVFSLPNGESLCLVAIRNIQWSPKGTKVFAGCGVVRESQLENEWREVHQKLDSIFRSIGLVS